jgi:hypothetical protein
MTDSPKIGQQLHGLYFRCALAYTRHASIRKTNYNTFLKKGSKRSE